MTHDIVASYNALVDALETPEQRKLASHLCRDITVLLDLQAEVERLKDQPTAAQERAAIIHFVEKCNQEIEVKLRSAQYGRAEAFSAQVHITDELIKAIEAGEHWPTDGGKP